MSPGSLARRRLVFLLAIAVAGLGTCVFVGYTVVVTGNPSPTGFDRTMFDLARDLRTPIGIDVAKALAVIGSLPAMALAAGACGALLIKRRRPVELAVLVLGFALLVAAVYAGKHTVDRPRPLDRLTSVFGSAFPSGHAAYSTVYVALAVILSRVGTASVRGATLVLPAVALAAAIGLSRIYLQVHWWSDVAGGWGLGAAIFGSFAAVAMVVVHLRDNGTPQYRRTVSRGAAAERA